MHPNLLLYLTSKGSFSQDELNQIDQVSTIKKLRKKQYLLQEGDVWSNNAFVATGCVRTYRIDDTGSEHILQFAIENYWTGDRESLMSGLPSRSNIDAIEDSEIVLIGKEPFEKLCRTIEPLNAMVNVVLNRSFSASQNRVHAVISLSAEERYLDFIRTNANIANRVPQSMIASYLGISPETLSRVRKDISKK